MRKEYRHYKTMYRALMESSDEPELEFLVASASILTVAVIGMLTFLFMSMITLWVLIIVAWIW